MKINKCCARYALLLYRLAADKCTPPVNIGQKNPQVNSLFQTFIPAHSDTHLFLLLGYI